ncbi:MAG: hypothetical protein OXU29_07355, partial [Gammaproteobacteria bacterium]|nr:hypothetical protein [Gammaproteobacteria bacterium]
WNTVLDADPAMAPVKSWWGGAFDQATDRPLLKAVMFRAKDGGGKLRMKKTRGFDYAWFTSGNRTIGLGAAPKAGFDKIYGSTFRHEFGHYLDVDGALPHPTRRRARNTYLSSRAAKQLREDHANLPVAGARAPGAAETAEDIYRRLGVDMDGFSSEFFHHHLSDKMLKLHGGDEAAALLAVKKHEKRIAEWLKSKGVDFPYEELLDYIDETRPLQRGGAAMELAVYLARGDDILGLSKALKYGDKSHTARNLGKAEEFRMFEDFVGSLTNNKYSKGHTNGYYARGVQLFKTEVGTIHDKNLSEGFANYVEMRYDKSPQGQLRYKLARRMFPATTRRFGEILDEIGNGEHRYKSGRDHAAENKLTAARKPKK